MAPVWEVLFQAMCCPVPQVRRRTVPPPRLLPARVGGQPTWRAARPAAAEPCPQALLRLHARLPAYTSPPAPPLPHPRTARHAGAEGCPGRGHRGAGPPPRPGRRAVGAAGGGGGGGAAQRARRRGGAPLRPHLSAQRDRGAGLEGREARGGWGPASVVHYVSNRAPASSPAAQPARPRPSPPARHPPRARRSKPTRLAAQARAEDYSEALAFVRLLNALWRGGGGAELADEGRGVAHFTRFVREDLLGTVFQVGVRGRSRGARVLVFWGGAPHALCAGGPAGHRAPGGSARLCWMASGGVLEASGCVGWVECRKAAWRRQLPAQRRPAALVAVEHPSSPMPAPACHNCSAHTARSASAGSWRRPAWSTASSCWARCGRVRAVLGTLWLGAGRAAVECVAAACQPSSPRAPAVAGLDSAHVHSNAPLCAAITQPPSRPAPPAAPLPPPAVAALAGDAASTSSVKPPGLEVLLDLLGKPAAFCYYWSPASDRVEGCKHARITPQGAPAPHAGTLPFSHHAARPAPGTPPAAAAERTTLRAALTTACGVDVDQLAQERHAAPYGAAKEAAVLAALRLLRAALDRDAPLVAALRAASHAGAPVVQGSGGLAGRRCDVLHGSTAASAPPRTRVRRGWRRAGRGAAVATCRTAGPAAACAASRRPLCSWRSQGI